MCARPAEVGHAAGHEATAAFKAFERDGWSEKAASYGRLTGRITRRLVEPLLDAAGVRAGTRLLDVGSGPGYVAARAAERGAISTGVDIAPGMVRLARTNYPRLDFREGDIEDLPYEDGAFDAVVGNFVINHLPQPELATAEIARVTGPGGRVALTAWDAPERMRVIGILRDALARAGVMASDALPAGPAPFRFADERELRTLLEGAGLEQVEIRTVALTQVVADVDDLWDGLLGGSVRSATAVLSQPPAGRRRVQAACRGLAERHRRGGVLELPVSAKLASGLRP
jgi:ubiquinone/menaquinone biosynthesis C-methylase UbiE